MSVNMNLCNAVLVVVFAFVYLQKDVLAAELNLIQKSLIQGKFLNSGVKCLKDHPLTFDDIKTLRNKMLPDKAATKCFMQCLFMDLNVMDDMGKLSPSGAKENAMKVFSNNKEHVSNVEKLVETCSSVNEQDLTETAIKECDRAKLAFSCLVEKAPTLGFELEF